MSSHTESQKRERSRSRERTPKVDGNASPHTNDVTVRLLATQPEDGCEVLPYSCTDGVRVPRSQAGFEQAIKFMVEAVQRQATEDEFDSDSPLTLAGIFSDEWLAATVLVEDAVSLKALGRAKNMKELRKAFGLGSK